MIRACLAAAVLLLLVGCFGREGQHGSLSRRGFYYWQTDFGNFRWDDSVFRKLEVDRLYVRFFDIDWSDDTRTAVPVAPLDFYYMDIEPKDTLDIVPVVFITNETFLHLDSTEVKQLAGNVYRKIFSQLHTLWQREIDVARYDRIYHEGNDPYRQKSWNFSELRERDSIFAKRWANVREIQFDCDWTKRTRKNYFAFLSECRNVFADKQLSATIRLWPYKYTKEAGIPPVDRGMLMCYNAGDVTDAETANSIFDRKEIMSYLKGTERYPLPLDYALPVFQWAAWFREGRLQSILPARQLNADNYASYLTEEPGGRAVVQRDFVLGYTSQSPLLRKGDVIRFEGPDMRDVEHVAAWLSEHKNNDKAVLTFFHLNEYDLHKYSPAVEAMYNTF